MCVCVYVCVCLKAAVFMQKMLDISHVVQRSHRRETDRNQSQLTLILSTLY